MFFENVALMLTKTCPLECQHCITESSPSVEGKMPFEEAKEYISDIAQSARWLWFTGGEPMLYPKEVIQLTDWATQLGLSVGVVTGSGWVKEKKQASKRIVELKEAGLKQILFSCDLYHEAFTPLESVKWLAQEAINLEIGVKVRSVIPASGEAEKYKEAFKGMPILLEPVYTLKLGRAMSRPNSDFHWNRELPADSCTIVGEPMVRYDGNVYACCGPSLYSAVDSPLRLGNTKETPLADLLEKGKKDKLLQLIRYLGPRGLLQVLEKDPSFMFQKRDQYSGICDLCLQLTDESDWVQSVRDYLETSKGEKLLVQAKEWYEQVFYPLYLKKNKINLYETISQ